MRYQTTVAALAALASWGCSGSESRGSGSDSGIESANGTDTDANPTASTSTSGASSAGSTDPTSPAPPNLPNFDVGAGGEFFCADKAAGQYCDGNKFVVCGDQGDTLDTTVCNGQYCVEEAGCVECLAGQYSCSGDRVLLCDDLADPPQWNDIQTCNASGGERCDVPSGSCIATAPIGFPCASDADCGADQYCDLTPGQCITGVYFKYADFIRDPADIFFRTGYDVDTFENRIYVSASSTEVDVYEVALLDSDGDGIMEPNQHPDNAQEPGPIEERVLTFIHTCSPSSPTCPMPLTGVGQSVTEIFALDDRIYIGGTNITEYGVAGGPAANVTTAPSFIGRFSQIGWDDVGRVWYGSNESNRRVYQMNPDTGTWGIAFDYPLLAGSHMDGLEIVTQPETGIPYVYVSDMTSDYIAQYRFDDEQGWVQENLFAYEDDASEEVEGMGFGALRHFWATSGDHLYEVGGGDIAEFVDPPG